MLCSYRDLCWRQSTNSRMHMNRSGRRRPHSPHLLYRNTQLLVVFLLLVLYTRSNLEFASAQVVSTGNNDLGLTSNFSAIYGTLTNETISCGGNSSLTPNIGYGAICLTPSGSTFDPVAGRCMYKNPVQFSPNSSSSFSTMFSFTTLIYPNFQAGDGFTFFIAPDNTSLGGTGNYLGWLNSSTDGDQSGHNFAVEFRTGNDDSNDGLNNTNSEHVGIDLNSLNSNASIPLSRLNIKLATTTSDQRLYAWIDYDGVTRTIEVSLSYEASKPCRRALSVDHLDLGKILGGPMYLGFSSATGGNTTNSQTTIWDWSFSVNSNSNEAAANLYNLYGQPARSCGKKPRIGLTVGLVLGFLAATLAAIYLGHMMRSRSRRISDLERAIKELQELDHGPREFSYRELLLATKQFSDNEIIGKGGFGTVYRGFLPRSKAEKGKAEIVVAVKRICQTSSQGAKEFLAEVKVIGRLTHINMVPLLGWCHQRGEMLLVYEYMPNGCLQDLLFSQDIAKPASGKDRQLLPWDLRMKILRGVAAALVFLHEDGEHRVVHRDVKSSNVLLDDDFNARLGDFGLARLYDRGEDHHSTVAAGTLGYMAPESIYTGNGTSKSDVYSFGAMVLEVASGRKPADWHIPGERGLVQWVWSLHGEGKVMDAVDTKLGKNYDPEEMKRVLKTGLFCCLYDPEARPTMRQVQVALHCDESPILSLELPSVRGQEKAPWMMPSSLKSRDSDNHSTNDSSTDWGSHFDSENRLLPHTYDSASVAHAYKTSGKGFIFNLADLRRLRSWS